MLKPIPKKRLVLIGAAGVMALGIAVPVAAFAADQTTSTSVTSTDRDSRRAEHHKKLAEGLAAELGVDVDEVTAALDKVHEQLKTEADKNRPEHTEADKAERTAALKERLATAVSEGKLTQAEADAILKAAEAGVLHTGGFGGHRGSRH